MWKEFSTPWISVGINFKRTAENPFFELVQPESEWWDVDGFRTGAFSVFMPCVTDILQVRLETAPTREGPWTEVVTERKRAADSNHWSGGFFLTSSADARSGYRFDRYVRYRLLAEPATGDGNLHALRTCFRAVGLFRS